MALEIVHGVPPGPPPVGILAMSGKATLQFSGELWGNGKLGGRETIPKGLNELEALLGRELAEVKGGERHGWNLYRSVSDWQGTAEP